MLDASAAFDADIHSAPKFSSLARNTLILAPPGDAQPSPRPPLSPFLSSSRDVRSSQGLSLCFSLLTF